MNLLMDSRFGCFDQTANGCLYYLNHHWHRPRWRWWHMRTYVDRTSDGWQRPLLDESTLSCLREVGGRYCILGLGFEAYRDRHKSSCSDRPSQIPLSVFISTLYFSWWIVAAFCWHCHSSQPKPDPKTISSEQNVSLSSKSGPGKDCTQHGPVSRLAHRPFASPVIPTDHRRRKYPWTWLTKLP